MLGEVSQEPEVHIDFDAMLGTTFQEGLAPASGPGSPDDHVHQTQQCNLPEDDAFSSGSEGDAEDGAGLETIVHSKHDHSALQDAVSTADGLADWASRVVRRVIGQHVRSQAVPHSSVATRQTVQQENVVSSLDSSGPAFPPHDAQPRLAAQEDRCASPSFEGASPVSSKLPSATLSSFHPRAATARPETAGQATAPREEVQTQNVLLHLKKPGARSPPIIFF